MSDTQTPEMDAAELYYDGPTGFVPIKKARKMERERNKLVFDWHKACREQVVLMLEIEGHRAECAALKEQVDNLVAMICAKDREITSLTDRLKRMTEALDDALGIVRGMQAHKAQAEACEL